MSVPRLQRLLATGSPHILVHRRPGIGDVLMTTPLVHELKLLFPTSVVTFATDFGYLGGSCWKVLKGNPDIDVIVKAALADDQDLVLDMNCPCVAWEKPGNPPVNRVDLFARAAGVVLTDPRVKYYPTKSELERAQEYMYRFGRDKVMLVQPFASVQYRSFDSRKLKQAITRLSSMGVRPIVIVHPGNDWSSEELWETTGAIVLKNPDIRDVATIMAFCDLVLCPDSSILHLAGALDIPCVALFGPTDPRARINYHQQTVAICMANYQPCHCWYTTCPIRTACWAAITPEMIIDTCIKQLETTQKPDVSQIKLAKGEK